MVKFEPGQLVRFTTSAVMSLDKAVFYSNGKYAFPEHGSLFTVISFPCETKIPKHAAKRELWCEVVDSEGRVGAFYPVAWLQVVE